MINDKHVFIELFKYFEIHDDILKLYFDNLTPWAPL